MSHAESIYEKLQRWCKMGSDLIWRIIYFPTPATVGLWYGRIPEKIDSDNFHTYLRCELQKCARNSIMAFWGTSKTSKVYVMFMVDHVHSNFCFSFFGQSNQKTKKSAIIFRQIVEFCSFFWENWGDHKLLLRFTDL